MLCLQSAPDSPLRPEVTLAVTRGTKRLLHELGFVALPEFRLPNGRRADLAGFDVKGRLVIAEVKSCQADFDLDAKWREYIAYCDLFYFAVARDFPVELLPPEEGLILADGFGGAVLREAAVRPLIAARRKALTLSFARQATERLEAHMCRT